MSFSLDDDYETNWRDSDTVQRRVWLWMTIGVVVVCALAILSTKR
jgi:hypothetical protein